MNDEELFAKLKEMADKKIYLFECHPDYPEMDDAYEHVETLDYDENIVITEESVFRNIETGTLFTIYQEVFYDNTSEVYETEINKVREVEVVKKSYKTVENIF